MPRGDRTGPAGAGPMTGRGAGFCAGYGAPGYANPGPRCGLGFGGGRGWRHWFHATGLPRWMRFAGRQVNADAEKQALKNQAQALQDELDAVKTQLSEMEAGQQGQ
jgi:hypothetical protein